MHRALLVALMMLPLGMPPESAWGGLPDLAGNPIRGRDKFISLGCITCHAVRGAGGRTGPDLTRSLVGSGTLAISAAMLTHFPRMMAAGERAGQVALPTVTPADLDDVIAYLFAINFVGEPGSASVGRQVFVDAECVRCHGPGASGGDAPPLGRGALDAPAVSVAQTMWNHGAVMWHAQETAGVRWHTFAPGEFADLLAFLGARPERLGTPGKRLAGDPDAGRRVFESKGCVGCHGTDASGAKRASDLTTIEWHRTATEIAAEMWNHGPRMWGRIEDLGITVGRLEGTDMRDLLTFLYLVRSEREPGDPRRGAAVFDQKGCARCHHEGGPGALLAGRADFDTPIHFAAIMWNHAPRMNARFVEDGLPWPTFSATDVRDLVAFLQGTPSAAGDGG